MSGNPFVRDTRIEDLDCHTAPCCGEAFLAPRTMMTEGAEAVKDHMAECMVDHAPGSERMTAAEREQTIAATRAMFE